MPTQPLVDTRYRWIIVAAGGLLGCVAMGAMFSLPVLRRDPGHWRAGNVVKDIQQAEALISALSFRRPAELADSWAVAWRNGKQWRRKLESGKARLSSEIQATLNETVSRR
jgi:hypothetical protein